MQRVNHMLAYKAYIKLYINIYGQLARSFMDWHIFMGKDIEASI